MSSTAVQVALPIIFGAIAGGITNAVAIWMLFHPYQAPRLFGWRIRALQGAIPKNKARLAAAIGHTIGTRLLTGDDLARAASAPAFRAAFDQRLSRFLAAVLDEPRGSLDEFLTPTLAAEARTVLDHATTTLLERFDRYLAGDEFRATAHRWADSLAAEVAERPIGELLTPEREDALASLAERWIADAMNGAGFERAIAESLERVSIRLLEPGRTFQELLPVGLIATVEKAIAGYLPIALERLGGLLEDPETRALLQRVLHEVLDHFMRDLKFHQRLVASLLITSDTVDKVLRAVEAEGASKVSELLREPAARDAMARGVNDAIVDFLRRPVDSVLGRPGDSNVEQARETIGAWALALAREPRTHAYLAEKLKGTLHAAERRTWGDLFRHLPPEKIADLIVEAARGERARALYLEMAGHLATRILQTPIGRPADHLPPDAPLRIEQAISEPLWGWVQEQIPDIARRVDVAGEIEQKMLEFPMERVEELIRSVTERELVLIVQLGYLLGAVVGTISAMIGLAVGY